MNLKNLIRVGTVSSVNYDEGKIRVTFDDQGKIVTDELPMLSFEYYMPAVGDKVYCLFLGNSLSKGLCLGKYFNKKETPVESGEDIYYKHFFQQGYLKYDRASKTLTINAEKLRAEGSIQVNIQGGVVIIDGSQILLGAGAGEGVPLGVTLKQWLDTHTHPYSWTSGAGSSETSPPSTPSPDPSTKVFTE